jgi:Sec-independent protein translocase protein TatA
VIDENSPEMQRALAPYYDTVAEFNRKVNDRNAEAEEEQAKREKEYAEKDQQQKAELTQALAKREADRKTAEQAAGQNRNPNDAWRSSSRQQIQDFQFGPDDEQQSYHGSAQSSIPTAPVAQDPWAAPQGSWSTPTTPPPPPSEPPAEPPRSRPPARHQRSSYGEDDDDMSNQSWLQ